MQMHVTTVLTVRVMGRHRIQSPTVLQQHARPFFGSHDLVCIQPHVWTPAPGSPDTHCACIPHTSSLLNRTRTAAMKVFLHSLLGELPTA